MRGVSRGALSVLAAGALATSVTGLVPETASATPGSGVTAKVLMQETVGGTDYVLREITIQPGGTTGWHFHDGTLYGFVTSGTLTHYSHDCKVDGVYHAGASLTEPDGSNHVHVGRNEGTAPMVLEVLYVIPHGKPLAEDAPNPGCTFQ